MKTPLLLAMFLVSVSFSFAQEFDWSKPYVVIPAGTVSAAQADEMIDQQRRISRQLAELAAQQKEAAATAKMAEITRSIQENARIESAQTDDFWKARREFFAREAAKQK